MPSAPSVSSAPRTDACLASSPPSDLRGRSTPRPFPFPWRFLLPLHARFMRLVGLDGKRPGSQSPTTSDAARVRCCCGIRSVRDTRHSPTQRWLWCLGVSWTRAAKAAYEGGCSVCANQSPQLGHFSTFARPRAPRVSLIGLLGKLFGLCESGVCFVGCSFGSACPLRSVFCSLPCNITSPSLRCAGCVCIRLVRVRVSESEFVVTCFVGGSFGNTASHRCGCVARVVSALCAGSVQCLFVSCAPCYHASLHFWAFYLCVAWVVGL